MATVTIFGDASDGTIFSQHATYATARTGAGLIASTTNVIPRVGQRIPGNYQIDEVFLAFDTSAIGGTASSSTLSLVGQGDESTTDFTIEARLYDWGTTVTTADWVPGENLGTYTLLATYATVGGWLGGSSYNNFTESGTAFSDNIAAGMTRIVLASDRLRLGTTPTASEAVLTRSADNAGTTQDPKLVLVGVSVASTDEILNPTGDVAINSWTTDTGATTDLYTAIDESTASDTDYIQSPVGPTTADYYETALETFADPLSSTGHIAHYRYQKNISGGAVDLTVGLYQSTTLITSWAHTGIANSWVTQDQTLSGAEADSITDYNNLRLRFTPDMVTSDQTTPVPTFVADRASANSNSGVTTVDLVLTSLTVGNYLIIRSAANNAGGGGAAVTFTLSNQSGTPIDTATDVTYQQNNDPGAASVGVTCNVGVAKITATSGTVRITYGASVVQACVVEEWSGIHDTTPVVGTPVGANGVASTNMASLAEASVALGNVAYGVEAIEGPSTDLYVQDADTTSGSWVDLTKVGTTNVTATDNMTIYGGYKTVTAAGAQTYNPTITATARDTAGLILELAAAPTPAPTIRARVSWANLELPAGGTDATATPTTVASVSAVEAPIISTGQSAAPGVVVAQAAVAAPTVETSSPTHATATPTVAAAVAAVASPAVSTGTKALPAAAAGVAAVPAPTVSVTSSATATPVVAAAVAAVDAPTVSASSNATATPTVAAAVSEAGSPAVSTGTKATPSVAPAVAAIPAPSVATGQQATPATAAAVAAVATPSVATGQQALPASVASIAAVGAPTVTAPSNATAAPTMVPAVAQVGTPTTTAPSNATASPTAVTATAAIAGPTVTAPSNATTTPTTVAAVADVSVIGVAGNYAGGYGTGYGADGSVSTGSAATPAVIAALVSIPTPSITSSSGVTANPAAVAATANVPAPLLSTGLRATPSTVVAVAAVPGSTVTAPSNATATPTTVTTTTVVGIPTVAAGQRALPAIVSAVAAVGAPTVTATSTATAMPASVATTATVGAADVTAAGNATATPDEVVALAAVGTPTVSTATGATATPPVVAASAAVGSPTVTAPTNQTATPTPVVTTASIATPAISTGQAATPGTVDAVAAVGSPTTDAATPATATPTSVATSAAVGNPTVSTGSNPTPVTFLATVTIGAPTVGAGTSIVPATVALLAAIGPPVVFAGTIAHIPGPVYATTVRTCGALAAPGPSATTAGVAGTGRTIVTVNGSSSAARVSDNGETFVEVS